LHDLVNNYAQIARKNNATQAARKFGRGANVCTIWLKITPKLPEETRLRRRAKLATALRAAANFGRRVCRVFQRNFGPISA